MNGALSCGVGATATLFNNGLWTVRIELLGTYDAGGNTVAQVDAMPQLYHTVTTGTTAATAGENLGTAKTGTKYGMTSSTAAAAIAAVGTFTNDFAFNMPKVPTTAAEANTPEGGTEGDRWNTGDALACFGAMTVASATTPALTANCGTATALVLGAQAGLAMGAAVLASALSF